MGRTQYYVAASLDGYIAETDDGLQWKRPATATSGCSAAASSRAYALNVPSR